MQEPRVNKRQVDEDAASKAMSYSYNRADHVLAKVVDHVQQIACVVKP